MRILLSEGSGLTSRQVATRLGMLGHEVEVLSASRLCLARFTRHVRRVHAVPNFGSDPEKWFDAANAIARSRSAAMLFPTHEQVTVLAARQSALCTATVVPPFDALCRVQDKLSAFRTLKEAEVPQPWSVQVEAEAALESIDRFPVFVKRPISTASSGVRRVTSASELYAVARELGVAQSPLLVQSQVDGPLAMVQVVADRGRLVARHSNLRVREGVGGGASVKQSIMLPALDADLERLVNRLRWHGAISFDAILGTHGPVVIDVNPRIVEPMNAYLAGVDLVGAMLVLAMGKAAPAQPSGRPGVRTRQLLLAVLGAARLGKRAAIVTELVTALRREGEFAGATEELTPASRDPQALVPLVAAVVATLIRPASWRWFESGAVSTYALTPEAWRRIVDAAAWQGRADLR